jgi:iron complex transport system ATP-binding protein
MISVEDVSAGYASRPVLRNVTLRVARGDFVGLIGPNGCGKTTLLRVISGVLPPSAGRVRLRGSDLRKIGSRKLARAMACLPQHFSLDLAFTVRELVLMGRSPHLPRIGGETRRDFEIVQSAMDLAALSHLADRLITEISGGERQRVLIAMCLAQEPEVLLLDEPASHLDIAHQLSVLDLIAKLNRQTGMTVVAVFHDLNLAAEYCQRLLVLNEGRVEALGRPQDVLTAEMILRVYKARVSIQPNPLSHKPHLVLTAAVNHGSRQDAKLPSPDRAAQKEEGP